MRVRAVTTGDLPGIREVTLATGQAVSGTGADPEYVAVIREIGAAVVAVEPAGPGLGAPARGAPARGASVPGVSEGGVSEGGVSGWAATVPTPCGSLLTDLFVHPSAHGRGVGTALLGAVWPVGSAGGRFTFSSKHPAALPLYVRSGLVPSWPLLAVSGRVDRLPRGALRVDRVDADTAAALEAQLTAAGQPPHGRSAAQPPGGVVRTAVWRHWAGEPSGAAPAPDAPGSGASGAVAVVVRDGGRVIAVGAGRAGTPGALDQLTCRDTGSAAGALYAVLAALGTDHVAFCVPGPHPAVRPLLASGFRVDDFDIAMRTPDVDLPIGWVYSPGLG